MPCSCGNTTCPCGIPCCCLEESCKCPACEIALNRFCKICNKSLITDMQTDKETCSCFLGEPIDFINQDNPECRMDNIPRPVGYLAYGKLITNVIIPVPVVCVPQLINQRPISLILPLSTQQDSGNISSPFISDMDVLTPFSPGKDSGIPPTAEPHQFDKSSGLESYRASSCSSSTGAHNTAISCEEIVPSIALEPAEEEQIALMMQNTRLETEGCAVVQEASAAMTRRNNDCLQTAPVACSILNDAVWEVTNFGGPQRIPSNTQAEPGYLEASNLQPQFKSSGQSSKENENPQRDDPRNKRNEETDPIPLYIDTSTTQKMGKLLNSIKHSSVTSPCFR